MARSQQERAELPCPRCGASFEAAIWLVIDAIERPDLHAAILDNRLHTTTCPHCGASGVLKAPLLYHNAERETLIAALPLSVVRAEDARELVADLADKLLATIPPEEQHPYLFSVALVAELDGLRAALLPADPSDTLDEQLQVALAELLETNTSEEFRDVLVRHRPSLMRQEADAALDDLIAQLKADGEIEQARAMTEQRAMLTRFRATLAQRRQTMTLLLDQIAPLQEAELTVLSQVRTMLEAVDPQEVYRARLELDLAQQALIDGLLLRLREHAEQTAQEEAVDYLTAVLHLRDL
jgi:ribosomal protein S27AE